MERDHVPPANLFEKPRPDNLITRPICSVCHRPTSADDEGFRLFVTSYITRNDAAARLWQRKVVPNTLRRGRIRPFVQKVRASFEPVVIKVGSAELPVGTFRVDRAPIDRVLIRITKGLYSVSAPHIDSRLFKFNINLIDPFQLPRRISFVSEMFNHLTLGDQVYDCWWALASEDVRHGVWVHMFFRSVAFAVYHSV